MVKIKDAMIWKTGGSFVITVPMDYVDNGLVSIGKSYDVELSEAK